MRQMVDFIQEHVEEAAALALQAYEKERAATPCLPESNFIPWIKNSLSELATNSLGVAALSNGELVGFLTCYSPWDNAFGRVKGTFSPIHAHGATGENRVKTYSLLYQAAAEKWVSHSILSHAVGLYAHDAEALGSFFINGFGCRTVDALRTTQPLPCQACVDIREISVADAHLILPLVQDLHTHLAVSPTFFPKQSFPKTTNDIIPWMLGENHYYFGAFQDQELVAYLKLKPEGENFATLDHSMMNICGAYTLPAHRGRELSAQLLAFVTDWCREEGYALLGVDYESFNPTAQNYWPKHFVPYTYGVVRRIDERILP